MTQLTRQAVRKQFFANFGRLPKTWWIVCISVLAGFSEGLGFMFFVPLLGIMAGEASSSGEIIEIVNRAFGFLSIPINVSTMLGTIVILVLGSSLLTYAQRRMAYRAYNDYCLMLRTQITENMLRSTWSHLSKQAGGEIINNLVNEASRASTGLLMQINLVTAVIQVVVLGSFSAALSIPLVIIVIIFSGIIVLTSLPFLQRAHRFGAGATEANKEHSFYTVDYMSGAKLIKITASEEPTLARINSLDQKVYNMRLGGDINSIGLHLVLQVIPAFLLAAVILVAYYKLGMSSASVLTFLALIMRISPRLAEIQQRYASFANYLPALLAIDDMINECLTNSEDMVPDGIRFETLKSEIQFSNVSFNYPKSNVSVIHDVNLRIPRKQMVALVGSSGSGKTTLTNLLTGLYRPDKGQILIDGVDLLETDLRSWRQRVGYVTQDIVTFNDTMLNNLLFCHPEASDQDVAEVLELAHLTEFVAQLPEGMQTVMGEHGVRLSGGQKQRLALARALLGKPELLLLDEATSALDNESERIILKAINSVANTCTILIIAHRLSTVRKADLIAVMENGRMVETGTYSELIAKKGRFATLQEMEFLP